MNAFQKMEKDLIAERQRMYGIAWEAFDWYGIPVRDIPETQRKDLLKWIQS